MGMNFATKIINTALHPSNDIYLALNRIVHGWVYHKELQRAKILPLKVYVKGQIRDTSLKNKLLWTESTYHHA